MIYWIESNTGLTKGFYGKLIPMGNSYICIVYLDIFNSLGSKKGTIFYYNPRKVHSKALILLWNDHQFSIFWFLTKVSSKCQVVWKSKSQVR